MASHFRLVPVTKRAVSPERRGELLRQGALHVRTSDGFWGRCMPGPDVPCTFPLSKNCSEPRSAGGYQGGYSMMQLRDAGRPAPLHA